METSDVLDLLQHGYNIGRCYEMNEHCLEDVREIFDDYVKENPIDEAKFKCLILRLEMISQFLEQC